MPIFSHVSAGFDGFLIQVEVFIRRGIPVVDIVGLPDGAVREAKERIRVAILQSGYQFPTGRILINLAPADIRKEGASFDLSLALSVLSASGQLNGILSSGTSWLVLGELELSGRIRAVKGTLPAVSAALADGVTNILVPSDNLPEALAAGKGQVYSLDHLKNLSQLKNPSDKVANISSIDKYPEIQKFPDMKDLKGQAYLKRALMVAAAGGHHILLFGPPGSGKMIF